jgi:hypothetical protein
MMEIQTNTAAKLAPDQRAALLAGAVSQDLPRSQVTEVTKEHFWNAGDRELGLRTVTADLDGDGRSERLRGLFDTWSMSDIEVFDADGRTVERITPTNWAHKVTPIKLRQPDRTVFLEWRQYRPGMTEVGVRSLTLSNGTWKWQRRNGWGLKHADMTRGTRASLSPDGILTVEWDLGDPARHTRVRLYQLHLDKGQVQIVSETFRPQGKELVYPSEPEGVLRAAYVAAINNLHEELPLYFASSVVKEAFQALSGRVPQELGSIQLVRTEAPDQWCNTKQEPVKPGPDGTAPFLIQISGSPTIMATMGTVTFTKDDRGRLVIQRVEVTGRCPNR